MEFEWDESKAAVNLSKHGVAFEEAKTVFNDPLYIDFYNPDHSYDEHRYLIIGESRQRRLLLYIASEVVASVAQAGEVGAQEPEHTGSM